MGLRCKASFRKRIRVAFLSLILASGGTTVFAKAKAQKTVPPDNTPRELELGKEASKEVEAKMKTIDDKATIAKLTEMCKVIGAVSERPKILYQVKIVDEKVPNAFTLPGGHVYVTKGLLDYVESDHELAGVLAHEIGHNAKLHALKALAKEKKMQLAQLLALGLGIAAGGSSGVSIGIFAQYVTIAVLNGFGVLAESEADKAAVFYLTHTRYNPVGLLTFLERLARDESRRPGSDTGGPDPGIFRTHPPTPERIDAVEKEIQDLGLPINRAAVMALPKAVIEPVPNSKNPAVQIRFGSTVICQLTNGPDLTAQQRAEKAVTAINNALALGLRVYEIQVRDNAANPAVYARSTLLVEALQSDAAFTTLTQKELATLWEDNFRRIIWGERINDSY